MKLKALRAALGMIASVICCGADEPPKIERRAVETRDFVEAIIPIGLSGVSAQIHQGRLGKVPDPGFATVELQGKIFAVEEVWDDNNLRVHSTNDPAMDRYLRLPASARRDDVFLYHIAGEYWPSKEYLANGKPLLFDCSFIIHLQEVGPKQTRVEILEYNPRVKFGEVFAAGHGNVGLVANVKLVPPTTSDRVEMLERFQTLASK